MITIGLCSGGRGDDGSQVLWPSGELIVYQQHGLLLF